jgi:RNA exonuclease 1
MCETASGSVCARVTLVSAALDTVYDSLVLPPEPITDYVTQFSGITAEIMKSATKDLAAVQAELLELVHAGTILVGHSLDNDLRSLYLEHRKVVDTAVLYPDARGRPYRRSLKLLVSQHFGATIQDGEHDSAIDAICSLRLLQVRPASSTLQRARNAQRVVVRLTPRLFSPPLHPRAPRLRS